MEKFIFDLDGTLLTMDYQQEKKFFQKHFGKESNKILGNVAFYLDQYERKHPRYTHKDLSKFLTRETTLDITEEVIEEWIYMVSHEKDEMEEGVLDLLEYLKKKKKKLVVLTNWFGKTQIERLKKANLLDYFDDIITGDMVLKPHKESYQKAIGTTPIHKTIMIGDNLDKDYWIPRKMGMHSLLYDKEEKYPEGIQKIKRMQEIKDRY